MYLGYLQRDRQRSLNTKYSMLRMVVKSVYVISAVILRALP